jgi:hypothetical protein
VKVGLRYIPVGFVILLLAVEFVIDGVMRRPATVVVVVAGLLVIVELIPSDAIIDVVPDVVVIADALYSP